MVVAEQTFAMTPVKKNGFFNITVTRMEDTLDANNTSMKKRKVPNRKISVLDELQSDSEKSRMSTKSRKSRLKIRTPKIMKIDLDNNDN